MIYSIIVVTVLILSLIIVSFSFESKTYTTEEWEEQCQEDFKKYGPVPDNYK